MFEKKRCMKSCGSPALKDREIITIPTKSLVARHPITVQINIKGVSSGIPDHGTKYD